MRARPVVLVALLVPAVLAAQVRPRTRGTTPTTGPAPLPPTAPGIARDVAYRQSRWVVEGYTVISSIQVPDAAGTTLSNAAFGAGTHADYRLTDHFSIGVDMTYSYLGNAAANQTAEVGTRFRPMGPGAGVRPYFDLRGGYMYMSDNLIPRGTGGSEQFQQAMRYGRGFGGIAGMGLDIPVTGTWGLTTAMQAVHHDMTVYRSSNPTTIPKGSGYGMTTFRFIVGVKYSQTRNVALAQNPRQ